MTFKNQRRWKALRAVPSRPWWGFSETISLWPTSVHFSGSVESNSLRPIELQASLSITNSRSSLKLLSIDSVMPSSHLILCCPLLLLQQSIRLFSWDIEGQFMGSSQPPDLQHARPPWPSPTLGVHSNSCPSSRWCHPDISSSVIPFSSSLPASESFPMSQLFSWGSQSIGDSALASFFSKNTQDWSPLEWTGWI